jgi:uncharacterized phage-associated protein
MDRTPQESFDRDKFKQVVHYICANCTLEELGNVKLHKALYFADMLTYMATLRPLTGVEYQKQKFGPVAKHLSWAINELCKDGALKVQKRDYFGFSKVDYIALQQPSRGRLTNSEIALLDDVIDFVCARSAKEISELSHDAAWCKAKLGETIPYYATFGFEPVAVTDADLEAGVEEARRIRQVVDAQRPVC